MTSYVVVYDPRDPQQVVYEFDDLERPGSSYVKLMKVNDFDKDGRDELLVYAWNLEGTAEETRWCVLGYREDRFSCWKLPPLERAAKRRLKSGEHFCCKSWWLNYQDGRLWAERWVYREGDSNANPSRGSIAVELIPDKGAIRVGRIWRNPHKKPS